MPRSGTRVNALVEFCCGDWSKGTASSFSGCVGVGEFGAGLTFWCRSSASRRAFTIRYKSRREDSKAGESNIDIRRDQSESGGLLFLI